MTGRAAAGADAPPELAALTERMEELCDLHAIGALLFWDQNTMMPPAGAPARGDHAATLQRVVHERIAHPEVGLLLAQLEPWADDEDPDDDRVRLVRWVRRDHEKAIRVPVDLAAELSRAAALGQQAWQEARTLSDWSRFRDALARHLELRHRYIACFDAVEHPYDVLLDDFEPGLTTAELGPLLERLREALVPLVAVAADRGQLPNGGALAGAYPEDDQRRAVLDLLAPMGFDGGRWRLDTAPHPFAQGIGLGDTRITTRYDPDDLGMALYSALHEYGHGLYEAGIDDRLRRTPLAEPVSLGVHESQSRLWENVLGRSRPFCAWALPRLKAQLPGGLDGLDAAGLYRAVNSVRPSLIRVEADETTYNLHIVLRFELEVALIEGRLGVDDVPAAWAEGMQRLLEIEVPDDASGALQDVHWGAGLFGYFPTYTLGNLMAAQFWARARADLPELDEQIARGEFDPLREWLREHVHRHGRKFPPRELLLRTTGEELRIEPFLGYLRGKLEDAGIL